MLIAQQHHSTISSELNVVCDVAVAAIYIYIHTYTQTRVEF